MKDRYEAKEQFVEGLVEVHSSVLVTKLNGRGDSQSIQKLARLMKKAMPFFVDEVIDKTKESSFRTGRDSP